MIKLDRDPTDLTYTADLRVDLKSNHQLIVLIPSGIDYNVATRRIWELASVAGMSVQLLGLCQDAADEPALRRGLVTMASLLQDSQICADMKVEIGTNWMDVVTAHYAAGAVIACFAEQRTGTFGRPLSQVLESTFQATIYVFSDLTLKKSIPNALSQVIAWLGFIGIIIGFGILQANIVQLAKGWLQNILLTLSILPEFWLIWVWNGRFG